MSTAPTEVDDLRREMARIRREMHLDVQGVVASAEAATDWHRYLTAYPLVSLGVAFAAGYLIVPKRKGRNLEEAVERALSSSAVNPVRQVVVEPPKDRRKGLIGAAFGMLVPLALRAAQGYALKYAENWLAEQTVAMQHGVGFPPQPENAGRRPQPGGPGPQGGGTRPRAA